MTKILNNTLSLERRSVNSLEDLNIIGGADKVIVECKGENTLYLYVAGGSSFLVNDKTICETVNGGSSRWVGVAGKNNYYSGDVSGSFFSQCLSTADLSLVGASDGHLMHVIDVDSVFQYFAEDDGNLYRVDGFSVFNGMDSGKWVGVFGCRAKYDVADREYLFEKNFVKNGMAYPFVLMGIGGKQRYLIDDYDSFCTLLFWEFQTESGRIVSDLRFDVLGAVESFINNYMIEDDGAGNISESIIVRCYVRIVKGYGIKKRTVSYNALIADLKHSGNSQNRRICTIQNADDFDNRKMINTNDFINLIYNHFFGGGVDGENIPNVKSTIGIPSKFKNIYNLWPISSEGMVFDYKNAPDERSRYVYNSVLNDTEEFDPFIDTNDRKLFYMDSTVIRLTFNSGAMNFVDVGKNPPKDETIFEGSSVRVYRLVNNLSSPTHHYFLCKPIGVDSFVIPYPAEINNIKDLKIGVCVTSSDGYCKYNLIGDPSTFDSFADIGSNRSAAISFSNISYCFPTKRNSKRQNICFYFFLFDHSSGYIYNTGETFRIRNRVSGSSCIILPERII